MSVRAGVAEQDGRGGVRDTNIVQFPGRWNPSTPQFRIRWSDVKYRRRINGRLVEVDQDGNPVVKPKQTRPSGHGKDGNQ